MAEESKNPSFSADEWKTIRDTLREDPEAVGLPARQYGSVVFASFNIRKLGRIKTGSTSERDAETFRFLGDVCRHFDLLAIQEVMADTEGVYELLRRMGPTYGIVHSGTTGAFPGRPGNAERLAFIYNTTRVKRSALVTDISYDRTEVVKNIADHNDELHAVLAPLAEARKVYRAELAKYLEEGGKKPREPKMSGIKMPGFLSFVRTPFAAGFRVEGHPGSEPYEFLAVDAHLNYGDSDNDRIWEGKALYEWLLGKVKTGAKDKLTVILAGDLNLVFSDPPKDRQRIAKGLEAAAKTTGLKQLRMSFPFLFPHPNPKQHLVPPGTVFRTNVKLNQTFDQLGAFYNDPRLDLVATDIASGHVHPEVWGAPGGPDYGVFNFTELFSRALTGKSYDELGKYEARALVKRYDFRVSDHMPIWIRLPLPEPPVL